MSQKTATLATVLITAAWGSSFILMKNVADAVPALGFLTLRFGLAGLILALIFFRRLRQLNRKAILHSLILGALLCGYMILQVFGLRHTSASNSAFITSLSVLIVPFLSAFLLKKLPSRSNVGGVVLAFIGLAFITGVVESFSALTWGDFYTFLGAICVAVHIIFTDRFVRDTDPLLLGIGQTLAATLLSFVAWLIQTPATFATISYTPMLITSVILTATFCTAFAFTGQVVVQKYISPARLALIFTLEPVFAYLYALFIPGPTGLTEPLTLFKLIGCILIVAGMMLSESGILNPKNA